MYCSAWRQGTRVTFVTLGLATTSPILHMIFRVTFVGVECGTPTYMPCWRFGGGTGGARAWYFVWHHAQTSRVARNKHDRSGKTPHYVHSSATIPPTFAVFLVHIHTQRSTICSTLDHIVCHEAHCTVTSHRVIFPSFIARWRFFLSGNRFSALRGGALEKKRAGADVL